MEIQRKVIALGFFDGVHLGHGALLRRVAEAAGAEQAVPCAFTFDRSPAAEKVLRNGGQVATPGMEMECRVYSESGEFLGLGSSEGARLKLIKSFFEV